MEVNITKEKVEQLLRLKGISKAEFATKMGVKRQNIDALLDSKKKDINIVIKMAEILDIPFNEFTGLKKIGKPQPRGFIKYGGEIYEINTEEELDKLVKIINMNN